MPTIKEMILAERNDIKSKIEDLYKELKNADKALAGIERDDSANVPMKQKKVRINPRGRGINRAILEAIKNDKRSPLPIFKHLSTELGVKTTKASISTRLSKMKKSGLISRNEKGWFIPSQNETPPVQSEGVSKTGEAVTSSYESHEDAAIMQKLLG